ncbi:hypothetical protein D1007_16151 [Hordeum vulgare]|nr:hypothetical protein D1007_16151 [Hordeum vulgare]
MRLTRLALAIPRRIWQTHHGSWLLPFDGEAYFVRELDEWVGLCSHKKGYISVCHVVSPSPDDGDGRRGCPAWTSVVQDRVYNNWWKRHIADSLTYMGNAVFCLLETITRKGDDIFTEFRTHTLLQLATFRVDRQRNGEFRAADMRIMLYKCVMAL